MYATYAVGSILTKQAAIVSTFYTFGSPKTGNPNFVKWLTAKIGDTVARARVTNGADPSVKWIKNPFYRHLSKEVYYHQNNKSTFRECVDEKDEDNKCSVKNWKGDYKDHRSYFQTDFVKVVKECQ